MIGVTMAVITMGNVLISGTGASSGKADTDSTTYISANWCYWDGGW